ncbi:MAG: histidinol-phosphatase [Clostridia bacterium]|nr:histidinol-phosphatase [Clostridia bacterium]
MIRQNLHTHTDWDDGSNSMESMILAAKAAGLTSIGLSAHSPLPYENDWECPQERLPAFIARARELGEKYAGQIDVYAGLEWDVTMRDIDLSPYDYVIGSVHELPVDGYRSVDSDPQTTSQYLAECFSGDADAAAEVFFAQYAAVAREPEADIVGHFDLLTKFDEQYGFFRPDSARYRRAALAAMEELVGAGKIFEINTGAISRGWRTTPYPSPELLCALREMGGRITISSDAHSTQGIVCAFDRAQELAGGCGFKEIWTLQGGVFAPVGF